MIMPRPRPLVVPRPGDSELSEEELERRYCLELSRRMLDFEEDPRNIHKMPRSGSG
jgi:hypothetical protein